MSPPVRHVDVIIVGQGLAGTTLAWSLMQRDVCVLVLDRSEPFTASQVAAGLITPVTGKRLKRSWKWDEFWPVAREFYRTLEVRTEATFLHQRPALRLFRCAAEREQFMDQETRGEYTGIQVTDLTADDLPGLNAPWGGFEMQPAGNLDVAAFLKVSRTLFTQAGAWLEADISYDQIVAGASSVHVSGHSLSARHLVFCEGWRAHLNPWLRHVDFRPVKGEILSVQLPDCENRRNIHAGKWLMPLAGHQFRAGSTYDWQQLDTVPTEQGRDDILSGLSGFLKMQPVVLDHVAAVRPAVSDSHPLIGVHQDVPSLAFFNGLGTKGVLQAPLMAQFLCQALLDGKEPPAEVGLNRW